MCSSNLCLSYVTNIPPSLSLYISRHICDWQPIERDCQEITLNRFHFLIVSPSIVRKIIVALVLTLSNISLTIDPQWWMKKDKAHLSWRQKRQMISLSLKVHPPKLDSCYIISLCSLRSKSTLHYVNRRWKKRETSILEVIKSNMVIEVFTQFPNFIICLTWTPFVGILEFGP